MTCSYAVPTQQGVLVAERRQPRLAAYASTEPPADQRTDLDADVIRRFRAGDPEALGVVYDRFSRPVWSVAMSVLGDRQLAEDAMNETFMRVWKAAASFDASKPMAPWLFTVARRTAVDVHRRESRPTRGGHEEEQDVVLRLPGVEQAWEAWEIQVALSELSAEERHVVKLSHFEGLTHPEIAERLDVPVGTVKSRSHRAHRRLSSLLNHLMPEGSEA